MSDTSHKKTLRRCYVTIVDADGKDKTECLTVYDQRPAGVVKVLKAGCDAATREERMLASRKAS